MSYALIAADGTWAGGPFDDEPSCTDDGEAVIMVALGYPDTVHWDPQSRGFIDDAAAEQGDAPPLHVPVLAAADVPTPPAGMAAIFLDADTDKLTAKTGDGALVAIQL